VRWLWRLRGSVPDWGTQGREREDSGERRRVLGLWRLRRHLWEGRARARLSHPWSFTPRSHRMRRDLALLYARRRLATHVERGGREPWGGTDRLRHEQRIRGVPFGRLSEYRRVGEPRTSCFDASSSFHESGNLWREIRRRAGDGRKSSG